MVFKHQQKRVPLYITKKNRINYTMTDCYIYDAVRTPRGKGKATGRLHAFTPLNLITQVLKALQSRLDLDTSQVDDIILGCVEPVQEQGANIARSAALNAGYNQSVPGVQINRFCASGLEAINMAAAKVMSGQSDLMIAGGVESLSRIPIGSSLGALGIDPCFTFDHYIIPQGISADLIATLDQLSRKDVDQYAVSSQQRAGNAWEKGYFNQSVIPIKDSLGHVALDKDEILRPETTLDDLAGLKLSFKDLGEMFGFDSVAIQRYPEVEQIQHVHHAGNSSGITDGAAAVVLGTKDMGKALGLKPRAKIKAFTSTGSEPCIMLTGPAIVTNKLLQRTGMNKSDIDLFEVNEAFASVVLRFLQQMDISYDKTNVNGGAIAMGHPLGATGCMILGTLLDELERRDLNTGLVTLCIGGGMGTATIIERV